MSGRCPRRGCTHRALCPHCEDINLARLRSRIAFFHEGSPPHSIPPTPLSPRRKKQRNSEAPLSGTSEVSSAQHPHTSLSPQRLMSLMCFTREDQRTSLDTSGLVSFGASEEEIAVDDSMSLTASDTDEWVCSGEEPEAPPPSQSTRPSRADPRSHARCGGTRSRVVSPRRACPQPPRRVVPEGTSSAFLPSASSSIYACGPQRAHENMAGSIFSVFEPLYCSGSHHR